MSMLKTSDTNTLRNIITDMGFEHELKLDHVEPRFRVSVIFCSPGESSEEEIDKIVEEVTKITSAPYQIVFHDGIEDQPPKIVIS